MTTMRAAIYTRYSTDMQRGTSLEDQIRVAREYADQHGWTVCDDHIYTDAGISGTSIAGRAGLQALFEAADATPRPFDVVLVDDTSRFSRDTADAIRGVQRLTFSHVRVIFISQGVDTASEQAETLVAVHGVVDGLYTRELRHKVKRGLRGQLERGLHTGGRIYGYRTVPVVDPNGKQDADGPLVIGKRLEVDVPAANTIRHIFARYAVGTAVPHIADELTRESTPAPRGTKWTKNAITRILTNPRYRGRLVWGRNTYERRPGTNQKVRRARPEHEWHVKEDASLRIVSDALWTRVSSLRAARRKVWDGQPRGRRGSHSRHLLVGLATCSTCGGGFTIMSSGHGSPRYGCPNSWHNGRTACDNRLTVRSKVVDPLVLARLQAEMTRPAWVKAIASLVSDEVRDRLRQHPTQTDSLRAQRDTVARKLANLVAAVENGQPSATLTDAIVAREAEVHDIDERLASLVEPPDVDLAVIPTWVRQQLDDLASLLGEAPGRTKTELQRLNVQFTVTPVHDEGRPFLRVFATGDLDAICGLTNLPATRRRAHPSTPPPAGLPPPVDLSTEYRSPPRSAPQTARPPRARPLSATRSWPNSCRGAARGHRARPSAMPSVPAV